MTAIWLVLFAIWMELRLNSSLEPKLDLLGVIAARVIILVFLMASVAFKILGI
jgi:hypothetical protein